MLTKETDYLWARPSLVAHKMRGMELQAGKPQKKGNSRGPAYAYNVKELRNREMRVAEQAQKSYQHFVEAWRPRPPKGQARERLNPARNE
jgi:transposase